LLRTGPSAAESRQVELDSQGPMVGALPDLEYATSSHPVEAYSSLSLFSDGVFEIERSDTSTWPFGEFLSFMAQAPAQTEPSNMDRLIQYTRELGGSDEYKDDFSIVEFQFPAGE
jgi:sigma-B regulation protein RsbU (phosphoserine phosphatase)